MKNLIEKFRQFRKVVLLFNAFSVMIDFYVIFSSQTISFNLAVFACLNLYSILLLNLGVMKNHPVFVLYGIFSIAENLLILKKTMSGIGLISFFLIQIIPMSFLFLVVFSAIRYYQNDFYILRSHLKPPRD